MKCLCIALASNRFTSRVKEAGEYAPAAEHADSVRALINVIKKEETVVHIDLGAKVPVHPLTVWLVCLVVLMCVAS